MYLLYRCNTDVRFFVAGASLTATPPFNISKLVPLSLTLKEVCLGLVELAFPDSRPAVRDDCRSAVRGREQHPAVSNQETQMWAHLFKVCCPFFDS